MTTATRLFAVPGTMTSRERVRCALRHEEPDRVPLNYGANADIDHRLKAHFGLEDDDAEGLMQALGIDFRRVETPYVGARLHAEIPDRLVCPASGMRRKWVRHSSGGYWDYCDFPLLDASDETIANWPLPTPDAFDYGEVRRACRDHPDRFLVVGNPGLVDIMNSMGMWRGVEQTMFDLAEEFEPTLRLIDRRLDLQYENTRRILEVAEGRVDLVWIGEDLGSQRGPLISTDMFRRLIRPRMQRFVDLAHQYQLPVMIHSCGSSSWAYPDFIDMGITVVDTVQPEPLNMNPADLKRRFGQQLCFHGCISTAGPIAFGTVEETIADVRKILATMMPGGGYCCAPTHSLQDNSPTENVLAFYETAHSLGTYRDRSK